MWEAGGRKKARDCNSMYFPYGQTEFELTVEPGPITHSFFNFFFLRLAVLSEVGSERVMHLRPVLYYLDLSYIFTLYVSPI